MSRKNNPTVVRLEGELTIYRATELRTEIQTALANATAVEIDLSGVTEIDSAGIQLLIAAQKTAAASQRELLLVQPSAPVQGVFQLFNLAAQFGAAPAVVA